MRRLQITDLLKLSKKRVDTPYSLNQALLDGFNSYAAKTGGRLTYTQVKAMAEQLGCVNCYKCGYMAVLTYRTELQTMEDAIQHDYIGINITTEYIFPFLYDLLSELKSLQDAYLQIEIPIANVVLTQVLLTIPHSKKKLREEILRTANQVPVEYRLPAIEGFSEGHIIPDFPLAVSKLRKFLKTSNLS